MLLPNPAGVHRIHRLPLGATECLAEFIEVFDRAVDPPAAWRVRVCERQLPRGLLGPVLAPDLGKAQEVALRLGVAADLFLKALAFRRQRVLERNECDAQTSVVGRVLAQGQLPVQLLRGNAIVRRGGIKAAVLVRYAFLAL